jgi:hypothetical protein
MSGSRLQKVRHFALEAPTVYLSIYLSTYA